MASTHAVFSALLYLILTYSVLVNVTTALRCYICGGEKEHPCTSFQNNANFIRECSSDEESCRTSKLGNQVLERSCESNKLDDCSTANNIRYCFCTNDLCNGDSFPTDDEDLIEGSGKSMEKNIVLKDNSIENREKSNAFKLQVDFLYVLFAFLLLIFIEH